MGPGKRLRGTEGHCFIKSLGEEMSGGTEEGLPAAFLAVGIRPMVRAPLRSQLLGFGVTQLRRDGGWRC